MVMSFRKPSAASSSKRASGKVVGSSSMTPPMNEVRLNKWIADSGLCSRRQADALIEAGQVLVNGQLAQVGQVIRPIADKVTVDGRLVKPLGRKTYLLFHKPVGVVTTRSDERQRQTIYDCLPEKWHGLDPVGRLDKESSGALILTDDGDFLYQLTHPKFQTPKIYRVTVDKPITEKALDLLQKGILFEPEGKIAKIAALTVVGPLTLEVVLTTGLNRQIRRMFEAVGYAVKRLKRTGYGDIRLKSLPPGQSRFLTKTEQQSLLKPKQPRRVRS